MKLLFDHNLSPRLVVSLQQLYPDSKHVRELAMALADDEVIWNHARSHGMTIVSKDTDFYHRSMLLGHPPKIIWLRLGNCSTKQIRDLLTDKHADVLAFDQDETASFLILS